MHLVKVTKKGRKCFLDVPFLNLISVQNNQYAKVTTFRKTCSDSPHTLPSGFSKGGVKISGIFLLDACMCIPHTERLQVGI